MQDPHDDCLHSRNIAQVSFSSDFKVLEISSESVSCFEELTIHNGCVWLWVSEISSLHVRTRSQDRFMHCIRDKSTIDHLAIWGASGVASILLPALFHGENTIEVVTSWLSIETEPRLISTCSPSLELNSWTFLVHCVRLWHIRITLERHTICRLSIHLEHRLRFCESDLRPLMQESPLVARYLCLCERQIKSITFVRIWSDFMTVRDIVLCDLRCCQKHDWSLTG